MEDLAHRLDTSNRQLKETQEEVSALQLQLNELNHKLHIEQTQSEQKLKELSFKEQEIVQLRIHINKLKAQLNSSLSNEIMDQELLTTQLELTLELIQKNLSPKEFIQQIRNEKGFDMDVTNFKIF